MEWGVCTTAKAPLHQLLAFVAWHKHIGAAHIWVHLDDADQISAQVLGQLDGVTAIVCDEAYWAVKGDRPARQEPRQVYNFQRIYSLASLPFIAHLDVDEYIWAARSVADIAAEVVAENKGDPLVRMAPAEALHDPNLPDDIFTAHQFRLPFPVGLPQAARSDVLGDYAPLLPTNMLSHQVGKSLFRTGVEGFIPKIHVGSFGPDAPKVNVSTHPDLTVLHFHAQDRAAWLEALPHRTVNGGYRFNEPLAVFLKDADAGEVDAFYEATQTATPERIAALVRYELLLEARLDLRDKIAELPF